MKPINAILILFFCYSYFGFAQIKTDSLKNLINQSNGERKVDLLIELANKSVDGADIQEHFALANKIYKLADSIEYDKGKCKALVHLGSAKIRLDDYPAALIHYLQAYYLAENTEDIELISSALINVEDTYALLRQYDSAIYYIEKGLSMAQRNMDTSHYILQLSQRLKINIYSSKIKQSVALIDELDSLLKFHTPISFIKRINRIRAYAYYYFGDYNRAISIFKVLEKQYRQIGSISELSVTYSFLGNSYFWLNKTDSAIYYHQKSIDCKPPDMNVLGTAKSYNTIGGVYDARNEFEKALTNFHKSAELKTQLNDTIGLAITNMNISKVYKSMENYEKAIEYNRKSLHIFLRNNITKSISYVYNNLGNIYMDLNMGDSSRYYLLKALILKKELKNIAGISGTANGLGNYFFNMENNIDSALFYYTMAIDGYKKISHTKGIAETNAYIADCYYDRSEFKKAVSAYIQTVPELKKERAYDNLAHVYKNLAASYYGMGEYRLSYNALNKHLQLHDSIFNEETLHTIADMQEKYDSKLKEKENLVLHQNLELTKSKNEVMRFYIWWMVTLLALLVSTIVFGYFYFRYKRRAVTLKLRLAEHQKDKVQLENKAKEIEEKRLKEIIFAEEQIIELQKERLEHSREKLHNTSLQIIKQNQRFASLRFMVKNNKENSAENENAHDDILRFIDQSMDNDVSWIQFRHDFEQSYPNFLDTLTEKFPLLNQRELYFLALVRIRLTSRQIADIMCVQEKSVKKDRARIKKKMTIILETNLYDYLCTL